MPDIRNLRRIPTEILNPSYEIDVSLAILKIIWFYIRRITELDCRAFSLFEIVTGSLTKSVKNWAILW